VEIMLEEDAVPTVLSGLVDNVGRDINWWRMPVMDSGMLD
jgi:hypothetical protein